MTKNDKKSRLLYLLELQTFDTQKLAITHRASNFPILTDFIKKASGIFFNVFATRLVLGL